MERTAVSEAPVKAKVSKRLQKLHTNIRPKLHDIDGNLMWGELAEQYFDKSASWFYNKLRGVDGNGGVGGFTDAELLQLKGALCDLADRIRRAADNL